MAKAMTTSTIRGLTYWLRGNMYLSVTNQCNSTSAIDLRGPSFVMPSHSNFSKLDEDITLPVTAELLAQAVEDAFNNEQIVVSSMDAAQITFAGFGEPLLFPKLLCDAAVLIKENRHGVPLRIKTNGLIDPAVGLQVSTQLKESGFDKISIALISDNPKQYASIMQPTGNRTFSDVCCFVESCVEVGLEVQCTAVKMPEVNIKAVRALALSLGAIEFASAPYFP